MSPHVALGFGVHPWRFMGTVETIVETGLATLLSTPKLAKCRLPQV